MCNPQTCHHGPHTCTAGRRDYRRTSLVLFVAGFIAFAMLYVVQGVLPDLSRDFSISPATASLTLSLATLPLAVAVLVAASWSEGLGRTRLLVGAVLSAGALTLAASVAPSFEALLVLRVLTGLVLAGLPAVAMAYVAEEFHPSGLGTAMGLYISGTGLGGMSGRLAGGLLASAWNWRVAMAAVGGVCLVGGLWVALRLPSSRNFIATPGSMRERMAGLREPLRDPVIIRFALCGFVLMGSLVSFFNYLQYRLVAGAVQPVGHAGRPRLPALPLRHGQLQLDGPAGRPPQPAERAAARYGDHGGGCAAQPLRPAAPRAGRRRGDGVRLLRGPLGDQRLGQRPGPPGSAPSPPRCTCSATTSARAWPASSGACSTQASAGRVRSAPCSSSWRSACSSLSRYRPAGPTGRSSLLPSGRADRPSGRPA